MPKIEGYRKSFVVFCIHFRVIRIPRAFLQGPRALKRPLPGRADSFFSAGRQACNHWTSNYTLEEWNFKKGKARSLVVFKVVFFSRTTAGKTPLSLKKRTTNQTQKENCHHACTSSGLNQAMDKGPWITPGVRSLCRLGVIMHHPKWVMVYL